MRFKLLMAALLAAFLAAPMGAVAADRPQGPETGQARTEPEPQVSESGDPEEGADGQSWWAEFMPAPDSCWFWWRCD